MVYSPRGSPSLGDTRLLPELGKKMTRNGANISSAESLYYADNPSENFGNSNEMNGNSKVRGEEIEEENEESTIHTPLNEEEIKKEKAKKKREKRERGEGSAL